MAQKAQKLATPEIRSITPDRWNTIICGKLDIDPVQTEVAVTCSHFRGEHGAKLRIEINHADQKIVLMVTESRKFSVTKGGIEPRNFYTDFGSKLKFQRVVRDCIKADWDAIRSKTTAERKEEEMKVWRASRGW